VLQPLQLAPDTEDAKRLPKIRLAEPFERLRAAADALAEKGRRPAVFLANLGTLAIFAPRAMFAKNLFAAGGIAAIDSDGFDAPQKAAAAFKASGTELACICSSDSVYAEKTVATARALAEAGAKAIYIAGRPREQEAKLRQAGVTDFIYEGCDVLRVLEGAQHRIA
jgi:methylmalonyl-CoA mutase